MPTRSQSRFSTSCQAAGGHLVDTVPATRRQIVLFTPVSGAARGSTFVLSGKPSDFLRIQLALCRRTTEVLQIRSLAGWYVQR